MHLECCYLPRRLIVAALLFAMTAGCRQTARGPTLWAGLHAAAGASYVVGEVRSTHDGRPIESAVVRLLHPDGELSDSAQTDLDGAFVLGPAAPGPYRLRVNMIAHRPLAAALELRADVVDTLRLRLTYDTTGLIADCIGPERPDGTRGFGSQFCQ